MAKKANTTETTAQLKKKLDAIFSVFIRIRDKGVCFTCGKVAPWKYQHNGHYISRVYLITRWDEKNCNCQCPGCNIFKHGNMDEYAVRLTRKYGAKVLEELNQKKWKIWKMSRQDYLDMIALYTKKIEKLPN